MIPPMESPPFDLEAYQPPISLWKLVEQHVPEHEKDEVKNMLGEFLVDQSLELHQETEALLEIWRDYREETTHVTPIPSLPEPPGARDRLVQEIQFFIESIRDKARNQGVNAEKLLSRHNTEILDYALDSSRPGTARRPGTAHSQDGSETPMVMTPTGSDRASTASMLSEEVESMNDKLNVLKFDEVVQHLRQTLEEECETLVKDISFLQNCLDDEATFRAETHGTLSREPTLTELREERSKLERELLSGEMVSQKSPNLKPAFTGPITLKSLGPSVSANTKVKVSPGIIGSKGTNSISPAKSAPLKVTHPDTHVAHGTKQRTIEVTKLGSIKLPSSGNSQVRTDAEIGQKPERLSLTNDAGTGHKPERLSLTNDAGTGHKPERLSLTNDAGTGHKSERLSLTNDAGTGHKRERLSLTNDAGTGHKSERLTLTNDAGDISKIRRGRQSQQSETEHDKRQFVKKNVVSVENVANSNDRDSPTNDSTFVPSPPSSGKPTTSPRPSSAQRFRQMVLECRDVSGT